VTSPAAILAALDFKVAPDCESKLDCHRSGTVLVTRSCCGSDFTLCTGHTVLLQTFLRDNEIRCEHCLTVAPLVVFMPFSLVV
jgi:hypothetical protein